MSLTETHPDARGGALLAAKLRLGAAHLMVVDVGRSVAWYQRALGQRVHGQDVGFNVWSGRGVGPAPEHTVGLRHWTVQLPGAEDVADVRARIVAAGQAVGPVDAGFLARDPWETAVAFVEAAP